MPYISPERAREVDAALGAPQDIAEQLQTEGDLVYAITVLMVAYLMQRAPLRFAHLNAVRGALKSADDEFAERVVRPYERHKRIQGGADPYRPLNL